MAFVLDLSDSIYQGQMNGVLLCGHLSNLVNISSDANGSLRDLFSSAAGNRVLNRSETRGSILASPPSPLETSLQNARALQSFGKVSLTVPADDVEELCFSDNNVLYVVIQPQQSTELKEHKVSIRAWDVPSSEELPSFQIEDDVSLAYFHAQSYCLLLTLVRVVMILPRDFLRHLRPTTTAMLVL